jgi:hypothetical protein
LINETIGEWFDVSEEEYRSELTRRREVYKRTFLHDPIRWTPAKVRSYLPNQVKVTRPNGLPEVRPLDVQFPSSRGFYGDGDNGEVTVSQDDVFGNEPFQFGTGGLHGCTMLAIISNRAVWMVWKPLPL